MTVSSHRDTPNLVDASGAERNVDHVRRTPDDGIRDNEPKREAVEERAQADWQDQDDTTECGVMERHALSRRTLFGTTGGFALAATGLLLPKWLVEDAAADNHPLRGVQRRKERKRGKARHKKHHDRHRRHSHGDHKRNGAPGALIDGIAWRCRSLAGTFHVESWEPRQRKDSRQVANGQLVEFRIDNATGSLWINSRYFMSAENVFGAVEVTLGYGGDLSANHDWEGGTTVYDDFLGVGQDHAMVVDGFRFLVARLEDDDDYKYLNVEIQKV